MIKIKLDEGAKMPTRAHALDAGLDLYARESCIVEAKGSAIFDTGVHVEIPTGCVGILKSKSGLNINHGIISDGTIDAGYTGSIKVKLYNLSGHDYEVKAGDKITQLVVLCCKYDTLIEVPVLGVTDRGDRGFGSSGR